MRRHPRADECNEAIANGSRVACTLHIGERMRTDDRGFDVYLCACVCGRAHEENTHALASTFDDRGRLKTYCDCGSDNVKVSDNTDWEAVRASVTALWDTQQRSKQKS